MSAESGSKNTSFQKRQSVDSISAQSLKSLSFQEDIIYVKKADKQCQIYITADNKLLDEKDKKQHQTETEKKCLLYKNQLESTHKQLLKLEAELQSKSVLLKTLQETDLSNNNYQEEVLALKKALAAETAKSESLELECQTQRQNNQQLKELAENQRVKSAISPVKTPRTLNNEMKWVKPDTQAIKTPVT